MVTNEKGPSKEMLICYHLKLSDAEELLCEQIKGISLHKRANWSKETDYTVKAENYSWGSPNASQQDCNKTIVSV